MVFNWKAEGDRIPLPSIGMEFKFGPFPKWPCPYFSQYGNSHPPVQVQIEDGRAYLLARRR